MVFQCGLNNNKRINTRCRSRCGKSKEGKTNLLAVDLGRKSFRGENDFFKGKENNNF
jgi:hypothetical protein